MKNKWYSLFKAILGPGLRVYNRPTIEGAEHIPAEGAAILASNHQAVMDSFYLPLMVSRQLTFPAKSEYFTTPGLVGRFQKFFFTAVGQIPMYRNSEDAGADLLKAAHSVLDQGELFGIYPEGTRSPDGRLYRGRTGMARVAMDTGHDVIPVAMINTRAANPIGSWIPRPAKVGIKIGEPINPHQWAAENGFDPTSREVMRPFTDYFMRTMAKLSGQPYVDVYATEVKSALAAGEGYPEGTEPGGSAEQTF
ncbi:lysophospholipid acyltransferase family protein [Corynebacterium uterequi]|uniref:1-acyl-sn-glycerol-3-phosphate acyltransferase n=1 Tax=Corynebacterium uterequi TaxID=1072256 RepID=A0A0G3HK11_9CORY|nr:lysophospholipid acyltransferase family protein [Corynebacterium uterequi]AKK11487.1 1-acyl-sn-glycerol-3-phosphate acyltransferase [Corynebacterium uterequi]